MFSDRWNHLKKILERPGQFCHAEFQPGTQHLEFMQNICKLLVIGAGGLGCELLKNLALMGFRNIHVIDMDTIDLSNLNRQFLFRHNDIGKSKAEVAAAFINKRVPGCNVVPHFKQIQEFDGEFYSSFHLIVCGLDSVLARRWINGMLISLLDYEDGMLDQNTIIPMVDGGTEGFKGNARVITPGMGPCFDCMLNLYPPQVNFPLCTIAHVPRLPEHCIEYVRIFLWPKEGPFGGVPIDGDDPDHINWIYEKALLRATEYNIEGITYRLTQGVIKHIIPAVASTNAVIAAICSIEVFKLATSCASSLNNYLVFNDVDGLYTYSYEGQKEEDCAVCSQVPVELEFSETAKLQDVIDYLIEDARFQMKNPGMTTCIDGKNKTLYMHSVPSLEMATKPNLKKTLKDLGLENGTEIHVADQTRPNTLIVKLKHI